MSWIYTNPDDGQDIEVFEADDGQQVIHDPRSPSDPTPYLDAAWDRRYRTDQVKEAQP